MHDNNSPYLFGAKMLMNNKTPTAINGKKPKTAYVANTVHNIKMNRLVPQKPNVLKQEQIYVYVPLATTDNAGIARFDKDQFIVGSKDSLVQLVWPISSIVNKDSGPIDAPSLIKVLPTEFEYTNKPYELVNAAGEKLVLDKIEVKLNRNNNNAIEKPDLVMLDAKEFDAIKTDTYNKYTIKWPIASKPDTLNGYTNKFGLMKLPGLDENGKQLGYLKYDKDNLILDYNKTVSAFYNPKTDTLHATNILKNGEEVAVKREVNYLQHQITTNTTNIAINREELSKIKTYVSTGENPVGQLQGLILPSDEELNAYVREIEKRDVASGDTILFILEIPDGTDEIYKYTFGADGWQNYKIPNQEPSKNGTMGIIEGTYNSNFTTQIDIDNGVPQEIYIKQGDVLLPLPQILNSLDTNKANNNVVEELSNNVSDLTNSVNTLSVEVGNKLSLTGGKLTGNLNINDKITLDSVEGDVTARYVKSTWLQTTGTTNLNSDVYEVPVLSSGWLYKRTKAELATDIGVPNTYIKDASKSEDGKTLTLTKQDDTTIDFAGGGGSSITVDDTLSDTSTNPVQNKVINTALNNKVAIEQDTAQNWFNKDPILSNEQIGIETDTGTFKIGNNQDHYNNLNYYYSETNNLISHYTISKPLSGYIAKEQTFNGSADYPFYGADIWKLDDRYYYSYDTIQQELVGNTWKDISWSGFTDFRGRYIWTYNGHIYYSNGAVQKELVNNAWIDKVWKVVEKHTEGITYIIGNRIWEYNGTMYCSSKYYQYRLDNDTWVHIYTIEVDGECIRKIANKIFCFDDYAVYEFVKNGRWVYSKLKNKDGTIYDKYVYGDNIWSDNNNIYYSNGAEQYVITSNFTLIPIEWKGLLEFQGRNVYHINGHTYIKQSGKLYELKEMNLHPSKKQSEYTPTKTSDLINDSGFLTGVPSNMVTTDTSQIITGGKIFKGGKLRIRFVDGADDNGQLGDLYLNWQTNFSTHFGNSGQSSLNANGGATFAGTVIVPDIPV